MADIVDVTFNLAEGERFTNQVGAGPLVTNNNVELDGSEFFDGDACGRWNDDPSTFLSIASSGDLDFGDNDEIYIRIKFQLIKDGEYALISRREDVNNRWHVLINSETSTLVFQAYIAGTERHNPTLTSQAFELGKWYVYEMACNSSNEIRHYINGTYLGMSTNATAISMSAPVVIGYANTDDTGSAVVDTTFDRYIDSVFISEDLPPGYETGTGDNDVRIWTGGTEKLKALSITPQPIINDPTAFPNNIPDFAKGNNQLYIAGIKPMQKVQGTSIADVGITPPSSVVFTASTTSSPAFDYVITYLDANLNESPSSSISTQVDDPSSSNVTISIASLSPYPTGVAFWRVYRRNAGAGEGRHYLVSGDIPIATTTYSDTGGDSEIFTPAPILTVVVPPAANHIAFNAGRMFYGNVELANNDKFPTRVYYSNINNLEQVDENAWFFIGSSDDDYITGMTTFLEQLIVFKENSMWIVIGDPEAPGFQIRNISRSIGCVAHQTIMEVNGVLIWLSDEGVYALRPGAEKPELISMSIEPIFENMPDLRKAYASAGVDRELGYYLLSMSETSTTENDTVLCYNYRESLIDGQHRWTKWPIECERLNQAILGEGRNPRAVFMQNDGKLGIFEEGLDLNAGINMQWQSVRFNPYTAGSFMRVHYMTANLDLLESGSRYINVGFEIDEKGIINTTFRDPTSNTFKVPVLSRGEYISLNVEGVDIRKDFKLYSFSIQGNWVGHR